MKSEEHICEFCNCEEIAIIYDEELEVWLCEEHSNMIENTSGYCSPDCQLGYGCDQSC